ncbi:hypothetical protein ACFXTI_029140 [Malus domestica]
MQAQQNPNMPVSEIYCSLLHKADKKFSKIRELPYYHRNRHEYDAYFYKVFKVYTQLWKFQQENRQKLVESGLRRSEIGEIASRIAQLYLGQYMRTSEASYLSEAYIFYEAILSREYFKEGMFQDLSLANKQLRSCSISSEFWLMKPLRYSIVLDCHPDSLPHVSTAVAKRSLRLRDAILSSYYHNEVKFSELTLDTFRMLQCLEWEPSGSFYQSSGAKNGQNGAPASSRINYSQDIADPTLPPNPRKVVLYRPSVTRFRAVLATVCEELPPDGVILIYLSASGAGMYSDVTSPSTLAYSSDRINPSRGQGKGDGSSSQVGCLQFGSHRNGGVNNIYPSDLGPFTRRPLVLVIDCDSSEAFEAINGVQKGETVAMLLSSSSSYHATLGSSRQSSGSLFTIFLTAPVQAFCLLLGISHSLTLTTVRGAFSGSISIFPRIWNPLLAHYTPRDGPMPSSIPLP